MKKIKSNTDKTILTICTGLVIIHFLTKYRYLIEISIIMGLLGIFSKFSSLIIEKMWFKLAKMLGYVIPNILLSIIFYTFLFPLSLIQKIFGRKDLLKLKSPSESTYINHSTKFRKNSFENPF